MNKFYLDENVRIFVESEDYEGGEIEITDWLYWFEENYVRSAEDLKNVYGAPCKVRIEVKNEKESGLI